jgi:hypothetical protein
LVEKNPLSSHYSRNLLGQRVGPQAVVPQPNVKESEFEGQCMGALNQLLVAFRNSEARQHAVEVPSDG